MTDKSLCDSCTNIGCEFQSGIVRTKCAFYMPPQLEPDNCGNYVVQDSTTKNDIRDNRVKDELERVKDELERVKDELERVKDELEPTTKNDLPHCQHTDEEIAKSFIEDVEAVKDQLHTKNDLGVDCISREDALMCLTGMFENREYEPSELIKIFARRIKTLPSVTPQEPQDFKWCTDCREHDQEKHCCHRWSKVIRDTIEEMKQELRKGYLSIDDVMSVFDDFMCGEVDEDGTETFLKMLKDKAESEIKE